MLRSGLRSGLRPATRILPLALMLCCAAGIAQAASDCKAGPPRADNCAALRDFTLADPDNALRFDHHCAAESLEHAGYWAAHALFENRPDGARRAVAVGQALAGAIGGTSDIRGAGLSLTKLVMRGFPDWAGDKLALALRMTDARSGKAVTGAFAPEFFMDAAQAPYQMSAGGTLHWENFTEPEARQDGARQEHKHSLDIRIPKRDIPDPARAYRLFLLVKNLRTGRVVALRGPVMQDFGKQLDAPRQFREMGLLETLNPFDNDGLFGWYRHGRKYRDCIYLRKQAKFELDRRL